MLSPLRLPTSTFTDVEIAVVYVLGLSFVTDPNLYNGGMRTAIAERMGGTILAQTYPNAPAEDQVWPNAPQS